jgi:hypothetical protein
MKNPISRRIERRAVQILVFVIILLGCGILWQRLRPRTPDFREISVTISGNVKKPGTYYVPYGTSKFEVLKVSGINANSDINHVDVYAQAGEGEKIDVGVLEKNVAFKDRVLPFKGNPCEVNFFVGNVTLSDEKTTRPIERGEALLENQKVACGSKGIVELKFGDGSLLDLKRGSNLVPKALYQQDEAGNTNVILNLVSGKLWAYVTPQPANVNFIFTTPHLTVEIKGTEIELETGADGSRISLIKGMVNIGRTGSADRMVLAEGQSAKISKDPERQIEVSNITDLERDQDLTAFARERDKYLSEYESRRVMYLGLPDYYAVGELEPSEGKIRITRISPRTPVNEYLEGVNELGKVYLYGGTALTMSLVERLVERRIDHYAVQPRKKLAQLIKDLGGVEVNVDAASADHLGLMPGIHRLDGLTALRYMSPSRDSREKAIIRQNQVIQSLYKALSEKQIIYSAINGAKWLVSVETDMKIGYLNNLFKAYSAREDWKLEFADFVKK